MTIQQTLLLRMRQDSYRRNMAAAKRPGAGGGCGKTRYPNRWSALHAMKAIVLKRPNGKIPRGAYLCSSCGSWHLTSKRGVQTPPWEKTKLGGRLD